MPMWKLNQFISSDDGEREESFLEESDVLCSLSPMQSLIVFAKPIKFALLFTFGNVLAVGSSAFLIGPARQLGMMFDPVCIYATAIYIGCVVLALICALLDLMTKKIIGKERELRGLYFLDTQVQSELHSFRSENRI